MKKDIYFLMLSFLFTGFYIVDVEAQRGDPRGGDTRDPRGGGDVRKDPRGGGGDVRDPRGAANPPRRGDPRLDTRDPRGGGDVRDPRRAPVDTRVREDTRTPARDTRGAASSVDKRGGGLSKKERVEACKKQYGKKKKNKAAKQACIKAAKGKQLLTYCSMLF